ncbi:MULTISPECIES: MBL fold metallo-hydrolase [Xanthomonas]|uniref:MBL fold metallo-hydrolase n=1 Tax=Xanthomonas TaxID=338 RepID=UPI0006E50375|nr:MULTISPECIES: MBL fold metallo-hydrolase [Xanthomonas]MBO9745758.1 MBL fold metallo-hydrolase [Xanthomonas phaseoli pv. dieffenbachiae]MBO9752641.1 MBL fold metallo-hydrolase [Xanthomonas phaseoli pv. dieffenbachiae]MBO9876825.1 MBL fold metallo-hydrolase [Xanthomonas sp. D-99]MBO9889153.1 MBL fold metallo-hydrolase [Xanthomonas sp. D-36-1]
MRVHHLNCISTCPLGGHLMDGRTPGVLDRGHLCCHCLLVETSAGLVLIDTGFGLRDVAEPRALLSRFFLALVKPDLREDMTAIRQIQRLGLDPRDVRHIVLTHLDFDHAGGLDDFPHARVHLMTSERDAALAQRTWMDRQRFRPQQWSTRGQWRTYDGAAGEHWMGLECVRDLHGLPPELLMVPLPGHTLGHAAVAVHTPERWLLLAGDAYFFHREMDADAPYCTPGLRAYQWMLEKDRTARLTNQQRLRALRQQHGGEVEVFCSHDVSEFERVAGQPARLPSGALLHAPTPQ